MYTWFSISRSLMGAAFLYAYYEAGRFIPGITTPKVQSPGLPSPQYP